MGMSPPIRRVVKDRKQHEKRRRETSMEASSRSRQNRTLTRGSVKDSAAIKRDTAIKVKKKIHQLVTAKNAADQRGRSPHMEHTTTRRQQACTTGADHIAVGGTMNKSVAAMTRHTTDQEGKKTESGCNRVKSGESDRTGSN